MKELDIKGSVKDLDPSKADQIEKVFAPMVARLREFEQSYFDVMAQEQSPEKCAAAKELRLCIARVRIDADKVRKAQKEQYLRAGNAIQAVYNILKYAVVEQETELKAVEEFYERQEAEKKARIAEERQIALEKYGAEVDVKSIENMTAEAFEIFLEGYKSNWEKMQAAEREAEKRRAESEEAARIFQERKDKLALYAIHGALEALSIDTTEPEFSALLSEMGEKHKAFLKEQKELREKNKQLQEANKKAEAEAQARRQESEAKEREDARKRADEERKRRELESAGDHKKLSAIAETVLEKAASLKSDDAKTAAMQAVEILELAADRLNKDAYEF